jgi:hypothetical protein
MGFLRFDGHPPSGAAPRKRGPEWRRWRRGSPVFLGFGFADPNRDLVFKLVRSRAAEVKREHFAILKRPDAADDTDSREPVLRVRDDNKHRCAGPAALGGSDS